MGKFKEHEYTVWKFHDFSITQFLREIKFAESKSSKTAVFAILGALNFDNLVNFSFRVMQKFIKIKIQSPKMTKKVVLKLIDSPKLI